MKKRKEHVGGYKFTTRHGVLEPNLKNSELVALTFQYLRETFLNGTTYSEKGCSNPDVSLTGKFKQVKDSQVCKMAARCGYEGQGTKMHDICQDYFMKYDPYTIALEVPVFDEERSGFIDILRYKNGRLQIVDFKPKAHRENFQKVLTQLIRYRHLLCYQLGIPESMVDCAYFDKDNLYQLTN